MLLTAAIAQGFCEGFVSHAWQIMQRIIVELHLHMCAVLLLLESNPQCVWQSKNTPLQWLHMLLLIKLISLRSQISSV